MQFNSTGSFILISLLLGIIICVVIDQKELYIKNTYSQTNDLQFDKNFKAIVSQTNLISISYETEIGKWNNNQISNDTMIEITNQQIIKLENIVKRLDSFPKNDSDKNITDLYKKSLENEIQSDVHFKNYILTNDILEKNLSNEFLSKALEFEISSFVEFYKIYK